MELILPNLFRAELIGRSVEVLRKTTDRTDVSVCGSLRVITALEFLEHPFSKLGHRDLLVTHTLTNCNHACTVDTRSVRRASGFVQTGLPPKWIFAQAQRRHFSGIPTRDHYPTGSKFGPRLRSAVIQPSGIGSALPRKDYL